MCIKFGNNGDWLGLDMLKFKAAGTFFGECMIITYEFTHYCKFCSVKRDKKKAHFNTAEETHRRHCNINMYIYMEMSWCWLWCSAHSDTVNARYKITPITLIINAIPSLSLSLSCNNNNSKKIPTSFEFKTKTPFDFSLNFKAVEIWCK